MIVHSTSERSHRAAAAATVSTGGSAPTAKVAAGNPLPVWPRRQPAVLSPVYRAALIVPRNTPKRAAYRWRLSKAVATEPPEPLPIVNHDYWGTATRQVGLPSQSRSPCLGGVEARRRSGGTRRSPARRGRGGTPMHTREQGQGHTSP